jgi:hypothetical protein
LYDIMLVVRLMVVVTVFVVVLMTFTLPLYPAYSSVPNGDTTAPFGP